MTGRDRLEPPPSTGGSSKEDPLVGSLFAGKYQIQRLIARGGMGRIYLAEQLPLKRPVALKLLSPRSGGDNDSEFRHRFFLEAATLGRLKHPNTVTVFDYGQLEGTETFYMAMEYVDGRTLSQVLREHGALEPLRALRITYEITRSLSEAHELNIVHRDLKPGNVMIGETPEGSYVKVLDFGIAKVLEDNADHVTRADQLIGSPRYMAPEQIKAENVDTRADQYALGVMLYEMLTGTAPFKGASSVDVLLAHLQAPVPPMSSVTQRWVPPQAETLALRMLKKVPGDRFKDIKELREHLLSVIAELDGPLPNATLAPDSMSQRRPLPRRVETEADSSQNTIAGPSPVAEVKEQPNRTPLLAVLAALMLVLALVLLLVRPGQQAQVEPQAPTQAPVSEVKLTLQSDPLGATVTEGGVVLGVTPLTVTHPAQSPGRNFELSLDGYEPTTLRQGASQTDLTLSARLSPTPSPAETAPVKTPTKTPPPRPPDPKPKPAPGDDDLGLRNRR